MARLAALVAGWIAVPLDVATRRDLRRLERWMAKLEREVGDVKSRVEGLEKEVREIKNAMGKAHSLETWPLNHAPPAASTPLLTTSFCMEAGARRRRRQRSPHIPRPRGQPPPRRDPASSALRPSPLRVARRGGLAYALDQRLRSAEY